MAVTSRFSVGRDTLIRYVFEDNFFERVPELTEFKEQFAACKKVYQEELERKGCTCRMTTAWAKPCLTPMLDAVEAAKKTNHPLVRNFIRFVSRREPDSEVDFVGVGIMYDRHYDIFVDTDGVPADN